MTPNQQKHFPPDTLVSWTASATISSNDYHQRQDAGQQKPEDQDQRRFQQTHARVVSPDLLAECGERLRHGDLVAFPTETVYGLGCNALDPIAVKKVFAAKSRPFSDPLIVHVSNVEDALELWENQAGPGSVGATATDILKALCQEFWPGPLTLVSKAASNVPSVIMANTGFVACRCPSHPLAQELIRQAGCPIAAPSANKFGHVSPTRAVHVMDDLGQEDVWVLEDNVGDTDGGTSSARVSCEVGVESTVAKLEECSDKNNNPKCKLFELTILRQGAVSKEDLQRCLDRTGISDVVSVTTLSNRQLNETEAAVAPGQTIKHYSPRIPSFLLAPSLYEDKNTNVGNRLSEFLKDSIVLDFGGRLAKWKTTVRQYRDLGVDSREAARSLFESLRWAEGIDTNARYIIFPLVVPQNKVNTFNQDEDTTLQFDALTLALHDRLTRAASGVVLDSIASVQQQIPPRS